MKLHKALQQLCQQRGSRVLQEKRLISLLSDLKALDDFPAMKQVMETVQESEYWQDLCARSQNGPDLFTPKDDPLQADELREFLVMDRHFRKEFADYAIDCIPFALKSHDSDVTEPLSHSKTPAYTKAPGASTERHEFRLGELFCGPGGLAYGALHATSDDGLLSVSHAWANDYDHDTCLTYRSNICPDNPDFVIEGDVRDLDIDSLGKIDAFAYGFPCNSFSGVGEHQGIANEKFGQLYWYGIKVLRRCPRKQRPLWFIAENVSGIRSAGSDDFRIILKDMRESGYRLVTHLYKAEEYGVPQTRHRVIIVGIRDDLDVTFHVPAPEPYKADVSARTALLDIPADAPNQEERNLSETVRRRLSYIKPGENVWKAEERGELPEKLRIKTKTRISQIYRKLDPDKPSYTITAAGGGGTFGYHWDGYHDDGKNRELTNRERARIQTFPDSYIFEGNYSSVRRQIGMAVPCRLAGIVTVAVLNSFAGIEYPWIEANLSE